MPRIWKFADDIDTDQIVPGRYAPYMRPDEDVGNAAFIEAHPEFNRLAAPGDILVAGENFGCGSSREYAPLALRRRGIGAIVAKSFARIFFRNAINLGIPVFTAPELVERIQDGAEASLDVAAGQLLVGENVYPLRPMPGFAQQIVAAGGIVPFVRKSGRFPTETAATT